MNFIRFISLAAAVAITATPLAAFSSLHTQSVQAVAVPTVGAVSDNGLPVIVITAPRQS